MEEQDFQDTDTTPSEEVVFTIAHQDEAGVTQFTTVRTTMRADQIEVKRGRIKDAMREYYRAIGHELLHAQIQVESSSLLRGIRARPRLRLVQSVAAFFVVMGSALALSCNLPDGIADADDNDPDECILTAHAQSGDLAFGWAA